MTKSLVKGNSRALIKKFYLYLDLLIIITVNMHDAAQGI